MCVCVFPLNERHFSLSPITLLFWIFWVCRLSPMWYNIDCSQLMSWFDCCQLQFVSLTVEHQQEIFSTKLSKPLLTCLISHSTFCIHYTNLFLCFSWVFTFLEIIKQNMLKMSLIFFRLQYYNDYTKIHEFW